MSSRVVPITGNQKPAPTEEEVRASIRAARRAFVTVLFTDIVDSTARAIELGDTRWMALLSTQEAMAKEAVGRFRGRIVKRVGDGMIATFGSGISGALCAARIVEESRKLGIEIRAGLHSGEAERHGKELGGLVFHLGARIGDLASGGEVLVSQTVTDLVVGSGLKFKPRGQHELKGFPGTWNVYALDTQDGAAANP